MTIDWSWDAALEGSTVSKGLPPDFELRWARAMKSRRETVRGPDDVALQFKARFGALESFHEFFLGAVRDQNGRWRAGAAIFFVKDADISAAVANGTTEDMQNFIHLALEKLGRGSKENCDVEFEFDSFENVQRNFEGSYFLRMR